MGIALLALSFLRTRVCDTGTFCGLAGRLLDHAASRLEDFLTFVGCLLPLVGDEGHVLHQIERRRRFAFAFDACLLIVPEHIEAGEEHLLGYITSCHVGGTWIMDRVWRDKEHQQQHAGIVHHLVMCGTFRVDSNPKTGE